MTPEQIGMLSLVLGAVGTALGIIGVAREYLDRRVSLRVVPMLVFYTDNGSSEYRLSSTSRDWSTFGTPWIAIEVVNFSRFPVSIDEVGLTVGATVKSQRQPFVDHRTNRDGRLPLRLEQRDSVVVYSKAASSRFTINANSRAYVTTSCDATGYGTSNAFDSWKQTIVE